MAGRGHGIGRGRPKADINASYQEYLKQCQAAQDQGDVSPPNMLVQSPNVSLNGSSSGVGRGRGMKSIPEHLLNPYSHITLSPPSNEEDLGASFENMSIGGVGRGRGKGRGARAMLNLNEEEPNEIKVSTPPPREVVVKRGNKGKSVGLEANFIRIKIAPGIGLFEYHVDFTTTGANCPDGEVNSIRLRRFILREHANVLGSVSQLFDGSKLYLPHKLPCQVTTLSSAHPHNESMRIGIRIKFVKENNLEDCVHFYNILFRRIMDKLSLIEVNRHYFDYRNSIRLPLHKLEIWPGYVTAVHQLEGGLILCCDTSHRVLRSETVLDVFNNMQNVLLRDEEGNDALRETFSEYVVGQIVLTRYNNKNYRIDDIGWNLSPLSTFTLSSGREISYVEYYKDNYGIQIRDLSQPLLLHRPLPRKKEGERDRGLDLVCLIPELSYLTGLTSDLTQNRKVMKDIAEHTRLNPTERRNALNEYLNNIRKNPEAMKVLTDWGLEIIGGTIELEGRQLTDIGIIFNNTDKIKTTLDFGSIAMKTHCLEPIAVSNWAILTTQRDRPVGEELNREYRRICRGVGIVVDREAQLEVVREGKRGKLVQNYADSLHDILGRNKALQFIVVIVPGENGELYRTIKQICCVERPIPSQVIIAKTLQDQRKQRAVISKIALQINCKLGGALWTIRIPLEEKIMFIGMDVYHDPRNKSASVVGFVASVNEIQTKYYSQVITQRTHQELVDSLQTVFNDSLKEYWKKEGCYPDRIIVFRDGVGDGQLESTRELEVNQMISTLSSVYGEKIPKFSFVVVQKRVSCRMFGLAEGGFSNPSPGTVLDHTVTRRYLYDFYLVSQLVQHGTVTPSHYVVLEDKGGVSPDLIQRFAFATCFLYYNWPGPIRVPAVCQYAHKLAYLVGQYVKTYPADSLSSQLYYL